ncbi:O-antigen ligase family protein [bacterium]|nr:O-antigen ligase family protein [bacterium]
MSQFIPDLRYSYERVDRVDRRWQGFFALFMAMLVGLVAFAVTSVVAEKLRPSRMAVIPVGLFLALIIIQLNIVRESVLFLWVVSVTYFRNYFLISQKGEAQGLYFIPSDLPLALLIVVWLVEGIWQKRLIHGRVGWAWIAILPWLGSHLIELTTAARPDWVLWEHVKLLRGLVVLLLIPALCRSRDWWICIAGIAVGVMGQSLLGISQVALRRSAFVLEGEAIVRAAGTMMHPNMLAAYLLVTIPVLFAVGFGARQSWVRWSSLLAGMIGVGGLLATQSRTPVVLFVVQFLLVILFLLRRGNVQPKWLLGTGALMILLGVAGVTPIADKILERISGNWKESVDFRAETNALAYDIFEKNQVFGVGPSHFTKQMTKSNKVYAKLYKDNVDLAKATNVRYILAVHNTYLLVLAEGGLLGFAGLFFLLIFGLGLGIRAVYRTSGDVQAACLGLTIGLLGIYGQGMTEYSIVMDQGLLPTVLVMALLSCAPTLQKETIRPELLT